MAMIKNVFRRKKKLTDADGNQGSSDDENFVSNEFKGREQGDDEAKKTDPSSTSEILPESEHDNSQSSFSRAHALPKNTDNSRKGMMTSLPRKSRRALFDDMAQEVAKGRQHVGQKNQNGDENQENSLDADLEGVNRTDEEPGFEIEIEIPAETPREARRRTTSGERGRRSRSSSRDALRSARARSTQRRTAKGKDSLASSHAHPTETVASGNVGDMAGEPLKESTSKSAQKAMSASRHSAASSRNSYDPLNSSRHSGASLNSSRENMKPTSASVTSRSGDSPRCGARSRSTDRTRRSGDSSSKVPRERSRDAGRRSQTGRSHSTDRLRSSSRGPPKSSSIGLSRSSSRERRRHRREDGTPHQNVEDLYKNDDNTRGQAREHLTYQANCNRQSRPGKTEDYTETTKDDNVSTRPKAEAQNPSTTSSDGQADVKVSDSKEILDRLKHGRGSSREGRRSKRSSNRDRLPTSNRGASKERAAGRRSSSRDGARSRLISSRDRTAAKSSQSSPEKTEKEDEAGGNRNNTEQRHESSKRIARRGNRDATRRARATTTCEPSKTLPSVSRSGPAPIQEKQSPNSERKEYDVTATDTAVLDELVEAPLVQNNYQSTESQEESKFTQRLKKVESTAGLSNSASVIAAEDFSHGPVVDCELKSVLSDQDGRGGKDDNGRETGPDPFVGIGNSCVGQDSLPGEDTRRLPAQDESSKEQPSVDASDGTGMELHQVEFPARPKPSVKDEASGIDSDPEPSGRKENNGGKGALEIPQQLADDPPAEQSSQLAEGAITSVGAVGETEVATVPMDRQERARQRAERSRDNQKKDNPAADLLGFLGSNYTDLTAKGEADTTADAFALYGEDQPTSSVDFFSAITTTNLTPLSTLEEGDGDPPTSSAKKKHESFNDSFGDGEKQLAPPSIAPSAIGGTEEQKSRRDRRIARKKKSDLKGNSEMQKPSAVAPPSLAGDMTELMSRRTHKSKADGDDDDGDPSRGMRRTRSDEGPSLAPKDCDDDKMPKKPQSMRRPKLRRAKTESKLGDNTYTESFAHPGLAPPSVASPNIAPMTKKSQLLNPEMKDEEEMPRKITRKEARKAKKFESLDDDDEDSVEIVLAQEEPADKPKRRGMLHKAQSAVNVFERTTKRVVKKAASTRHLFG